MKYVLLSITILLPFCSIAAFPDVVINELNYDPIDNGDEGGALREFVEIYNPGSYPIDLTGYAFTAGITYTFPSAVILEPNAYLIVAHVPTHRTWSNKPYPVLGPYEGKLANGGERLTLSRPDGTIVDSLKYNDNLPWPRGADGYGPTLERIAWDLPSDDFHSWRASLNDEGTPGAKNSVVGTISRPVITAFEIIPKQPTSQDTVTVRFGVDAPQMVNAAYLRWESTGNVAQQSSNTLVASDGEWRYWKGLSAPASGTEWTQTGFDDSAWETGPGGFGYGDLDRVDTVLPDMQGNYTTLYIRKTFTLNDPASLGALMLQLYIDDGFVCYINGVEVARTLVPDGYTYDSIATEVVEADTQLEFQLGQAKNLLHEGENVIALVGMNVWLQDSTDFVLAPTLISSSASSIDTGRRLEMIPVAHSIESATYEAFIPPFESQNLVRFNLELELTDGRTLLLPHDGERHPFESYFVYDGEIETKLPIIWLFNSLDCSLPERPRRFHAVVALLPGETQTQVFDGVNYVSSENGNKVRFLKREEFRGDRTINILPESPTSGGTAGATAPFREYLGFWFYRQNGIIAPRADWFRVVYNKERGTEKHTQRLIVQQINEKFLEMNGLDSNQDLYKLEHDKGFMKHTNKDEGNGSIQELLSAISVANSSQRRTNIDKYLDVEYFLTYSVVSVLSSNWDGFHNNNWMYLNPEEAGGKWIVIPWDLDKMWGDTDSNEQFYEMPVDFPLNGQAQHASRRPGPVTGPFHQDAQYHAEYKRRLRVELDRQYAGGAPVFQEIDRDEAFLFDDIALLEKYLGKTQTARRNQIEYSYNMIREFIQLRRGFLNNALPEAVHVSDWALY